MTSHQEDIRTIFHPPNMARPLGPRRLRGLNRKGSRIATPGVVIAERAKREQRIACGADCRAQIHQRLRKIPGARIGRDPVRSSAYISPPLRQRDRNREQRSEEHTSELQSLMRISYAVFCLKKTNRKLNQTTS